MKTQLQINADTIKANEPDLGKPLGISQEKKIQELQIQKSKAEKFNKRRLKSIRKVYGLNRIADGLLSSGNFTEAKRVLKYAEDLQSEWHDLPPINIGAIDKQISDLINNFSGLEFYTLKKD